MHSSDPVVLAAGFVRAVGQASRHRSSSPACCPQNKRAVPKTKMARIKRAIFVSDPVKSEFGCGDLQPSQIAAPDSGVRDAKIFFDTGSEPANQSHFKRQKRRPAGYGSSAYGGVSKAWLQIPKIEPVLVTVEVRRLLLDLPPCNNVSPVGPWWVQFGPQLGDAFRSCPENACPAGSWILRKVVRTASPLSVVLLQTRFRRH